MTIKNLYKKHPAIVKWQSTSEVGQTDEKSLGGRYANLVITVC